MKRFSVMIAMMLAAFVGSMVAPVFAQQTPPPATAPAEKKEPMKKPARKAPPKKAPVKKAAAKKDATKDAGMKKEGAMEKK